MVSRPEMKIWSALRAHAQALSSLGMKISWPNTPFEAPPEGYLRVRHTPNGPERVFLGSESPHDRFGLVQVMVYTKRGVAETPGIDNTGRILRIASDVADHFKVDQPLRYQDVTVRVSSAPRIGEPVNPRDSAYAECAVEIPYRCFA